MPVQLMLADGHGVDYWQGGAAPDKNDTTNHVVSRFGDSASEIITISGTMPPNYAGGNLTVRIHWASWTTTTGNVVWQVEFERLAADGTSTTSNSFATGKTVIDAASSVLGALTYASIAFSSSEIDGVQAGESYRIRVTRLGASGSDTMIGDALLFRTIIEED